MVFNDCEKYSRFLELYVDSQLDAESQADFERHLVRCRPCSEKVAARRLLRDRVRRAGRSVATPGDLEARILRALSEDSRSRRPNRRRWAAGAIAAPLLLAGLSLWFYPVPSFMGGARLMSLQGHLVCMGRMLNERYGAHVNCAFYGHLPALETDEGALWHLSSNEVAFRLSRNMTDESRLSVRVVAYAYPQEHVLEITRYQLLEPPDQ